MNSKNFYFIHVFFIVVALAGSFFSCGSQKTNQKNQEDVSATGKVSAMDSVNESVSTRKNNDMAVKLCLQKDTREKGIKTLISSIERRESVELNFYRLGICFLVAEQYKKAIFNFNRSLFNAKDNTLKSANLHNIAYAQLKMGKYKRSMDYLKESSKLSLHPMTSFNLASLQLHLNLVNDQSETYQWLKSRVDVKGMYAELLAELALSLSYFDDAVKYFEAVPNAQFEKNSDLVVHYLIALFRINRIDQLKTILVEKKMFLSNSSYYQKMLLQYPEIGKFE